MMQSWRPLFAVWLGVCGLAYAQPQSRLELIDSARAEKEANLTPETPPKAEQRLVSIQQSWPFRMLTGETPGFGIGFGTIVPGSGFAVGPQYIRSDLWGGRLTAKVEARAAIN